MASVAPSAERTPAAHPPTSPVAADKPCPPSRLLQEWKTLAAGLLLFFTFFALPLGWSRFDQAIYEALALTQEYAREHVLLLAGPALSLPNMLVIRSVLGTQKTLVFLSLVVAMSTLTGWAYGLLGMKKEFLLPSSMGWWDVLHRGYPLRWMC